MSKVIVVGGGAAGMMAAVFAAQKHDVTLVEQNEKLGKKLFITGKGRCNLTNDCDTEDLFRAVLRNEKFLYSAFYSFNSQAVMEFFEKAGLRLKTERGNRVFPVSDHSSDVIRTLEQELHRSGVKIMLRTKVKQLLVQGEKIEGIELSDGKKLKADAVILATGGLSYASTGSTGDGYRFAKNSGHTIKPCSPSLVPLVAKESYVTDLMGLSLKNVKVSFYRQKKCLYEETGEMLFTHFGVSGPLILSASGIISDHLKKDECRMEIDLKPALSVEQLDKRILRDWDENLNRQFKNAIGKLLPSKMIPVIIELSEIPPEKPINEITKQERAQLVNILKHFPATITGTRDYNEAIITKGGVAVKEINPSTMESKLVTGLYFAGEMIDLDAVTGGYNLQIAWATGYLAGTSIE